MVDLSAFGLKPQNLHALFASYGATTGVIYTVSVKRRLRTADCRLRTVGKMQTVCKMQTEHKLQSWKGIRVKNSRKYMQTNSYLMTTSAFTNPFRTFFSITSSTTQKHNRNLKIFLPSERPHASTLDAKFSIYVASDRELVTPRCLRLNESR